MYQHAAVSDSVRRWTLVLGQLRARASRVKRRSGGDPAATDTLVDEALDLSSSVLIDLAAAELDLKQTRRALDVERQEASAVFDRMPVASLVTDGAGLIVAANRLASQLLNVSARHLAAKPLLPFSHDRSEFLALLRSLPLNGTPSTATVAIRPRERRPTTVHVTIIPRTANAPIEWVWFLTPGSEHHAIDGGRVENTQDADADGGMSAYSGHD